MLAQRWSEVRRVAQQLQGQRLIDEGARAAKVLKAFEGQHPEIAKDIEAQVRAKLIPEKATMNRGGDVKEA